MHKIGLLAIMQELEWIGTLDCTIIMHAAVFFVPCEVDTIPTLSALLSFTLYY